MGAVTDAWPGAVGAEIARNAWPARFQRDGTLIVHTRDAIWSFELGQRNAEIGARLPGSPPVKFVPGPLPEPGAGDVDAARRELPPATPEQVERAARWTAGMDDEELRALVTRAAAASLARAAVEAAGDRPF